MTLDETARPGSSRPDRARGALSRVFVYGTLLAGESNHGFLAHARFVKQACTKPAFELRDLGAFPGLVQSGAHTVVGEVYEVDETTLAALDRLEEHPRFYRRTRIALEDGALAEAYLLTRAQVEGRPIIDSGSWRERAKETQLAGGTAATVARTRMSGTLADRR